MESIHRLTERYERWLGEHVALDPVDLATKHRKMASRPSRFPFFRATYYRWLQRWPLECPDLAAAPTVLAVGDLHVENFGTWRDTEGRLAWGVNDFDESEPLPYTQDLVRLAASAVLAVREGGMRDPAAGVCAAVLDGYEQGLARGGRPFVLNGRHRHLRRLDPSDPRDPAAFWAKELKRIRKNPDHVSGEPAELLDRSMPPEAEHVRQCRRRKAGLGSLGKPRFAALAEWDGDRVGREVKARTPPAGAFLRGTDGAEDHYAQVAARAHRCPDPFLRVERGWVTRRLTPDCSRIDLEALGTVRAASKLLRAMGAETANVHLAAPEAVAAVRADLDRRPAGWLRSAARLMLEAVTADWRNWRAAGR